MDSCSSRSASAAWRLRRWAMPFIVIGANALAIYLAVEFIPFEQIALRFVGGDVSDALGRFAGIAVAIVAIALEFALAWWLYSKRIFIRI